MAEGIEKSGLWVSPKSDSLILFAMSANLFELLSGLNYPSKYNIVWQAFISGSFHAMNLPHRDCVMNQMLKVRGAFLLEFRNIIRLIRGLSCRRKN
jgi:hypothetical protein